jgi:hypothetical protein
MYPLCGCCVAIPAIPPKLFMLCLLLLHAVPITLICICATVVAEVEKGAWVHMCV